MNDPRDLTPVEPVRDPPANARAPMGPRAMESPAPTRQPQETGQPAELPRPMRGLFRREPWPQGRWPTLDWLKAIAVVAMVMGHVVVWFLLDADWGIIPGETPLPRGAGPQFLNDVFVPFSQWLGLLPPLIPITAGAALRYHLQPWWDAERQQLIARPPPSLRSLTLRGLVLAGLGYGMNGMAFGLADAWAWDVLQFLALATILVALVARLAPLVVLGCLGVAAVLVAPWLRAFIDPSSTNYLQIILLGNDSGDHYFPLFPWLGPVIWGFFVAHYRLLQCTLGSKSFAKHTCVAGGLFLLVAAMDGNALFTVDLDNMWGPATFWPPITRMMGLLGTFTVGIGLLELLPAPRLRWRYGGVTVLSRGILWIYITHIIIGYRCTAHLKENASLTTMGWSVVANLLLAYGVGALIVWRRSRQKSRARAGL